MSTKPQDSASSQTGRTMTFALVAAGCIAITAIFKTMNQPASIEEYGKMGQEFYPEFTDPTSATSLQVSVIDTDEVKPMKFSVQQASNGQWVIPSHHNYPADAEDQLAETASSIIGIKRGAMISRWASDHAKYGVVDPVTDSVSIDEVEGIGKRITIGGPDDTTLASYIVGKKFEDSNNEYYVRHPDEDETYIAELDINLSTKFTDWVNADLLDITSGDVLRLDLNDYSIDEIQGTITGNDQSVLTRPTSTDDWKLAGLNEETEQVKNSAVTDTLNALSNMQIVGVRPKQPGLTADLQIDRSAVQSQQALNQLTTDLLSRGFILQPNRENQELLELIAKEGEMFVGAADGLLYRLYFGRAFTGSNEDLEFGMSSTDAPDEDKNAPDTSDETENEDEAESDQDGEQEETPTGNNGRYVFVRVNFDPTLLGELITQPVEPQEPAEIKTLQDKIAAAKDQPEETDETEEPSEASDSEPSAEAEAEETDEQKLARLQEEFSAAQTAYQTQLTAYEEYQQKIEDGEKKADDLNRRFALWYYVIPGDSYDKLTLKRANVVEPKSADDAGAEAGTAGLNAPPGLEGLSDAIMQNAGVNPAGLGGIAPPSPTVQPPAPANAPADSAEAPATPVDEPADETTNADSAPAANPESEAKPATENADKPEAAENAAENAAEGSTPDEESAAENAE
ncbi:MAG: DUF4340 domain-containing protein [Rubripirellula sp.]|nr:DUF4340 domain-containing protein [Rubripirellula sp.]